MRSRSNIFQGIDPILFFTWLGVALAGCFAIFSATSLGEWSAFFDFGGKHIRQVIFLGISLVFMLIIFSFDYQFIVRSAPLMFVITTILLMLTLVIGAEIKGSKSWIRLGGFQIQPAEFAKTGTSLMLAYWFAFHDKVFTDIKNSIAPFAILGVPMGLVLLQGDFGSMLTFSMLIFVFYREGFTPIPIYLGILGIAVSLTTIVFGAVKVSITLALLGAMLYLSFFVLKKTKIILSLSIWLKTLNNVWQTITLTVLLGVGISFSVNTVFTKLLKEYQRDRVLITLGIKEDLHGAGYNLWQSKMAIGSGKMLGKGYLQGIQTQGEFVPEVSTDYIFSNIGEEWGFAGSLFVVSLFSLLIFRILFLAERQKATFSRVFMYCAAGFFTIHTFINIGMVIGIFPTAGIPLPFFSYGGSSLLSFSIIIAFVLRLDAEHKFML